MVLGDSSKTIRAGDVIDFFFHFEQQKVHHWINEEYEGSKSFPIEEAVFFPMVCMGYNTEVSIMNEPPSTMSLEDVERGEVIKGNSQGGEMKELHFLLM